MNIRYTLYRHAKKPFFGRFMRPWRWPENIEQSQWKRISVASESGATLSALLAEAQTTEAKGAILMSHPMGAIAKGFWMKYGHADLLRKAGYHVMVFDLNGFGDSSNTTMDYPLDVLAAGRCLQAYFPQLPIAVMGASMGAAMSVCAMSHPGHPFKAAVLESAFPTLLHFWSRYPIPRLGVQIAKIFHPAGERRLNPIHSANNLINSPSTLLIYGDADKFTPIKDGRLLWNRLKEKTYTEFWEVSGAEHTHAYHAQPERYAKRVIDFLNRELACKSVLRQAS